MRRNDSWSIAVTGMACICAAGNTPEDALAAFFRGGRSLADPSVISPRALPYPFFAVGEDSFPDGRRNSALDTFVLAQQAAAKALALAALPDESLSRTALVLGTTSGSAMHFLDAYAACRTQDSPFGKADDRQREIDDYFTGNLALALPIACGGPRLTVTDACTSGADAIGLGMDLVASGQCSCAICGGADALSLVPHTGFARLTVYAPEPCRPFDRDRRGLNLGEAAAVMVLESRAHAENRKAPILGHMLGYGNAADACRFAAPHPEGRGLANAVAAALAQAGIDPGDVAFINAHGTATHENDRIEGRLLSRMFPSAPIWASKGGTGHTLGAAGALEAVLALQALRSGHIPPSPGFLTVDPEIGLAPTREETPVRTPYALSTSLGFGGGNAALVLGRA